MVRATRSQVHFLFCLIGLNMVYYLFSGMYAVNKLTAKKE